MSTDPEGPLSQEWRDARDAILGLVVTRDVSATNVMLALRAAVRAEMAPDLATLAERLGALEKLVAGIPIGPRLNNLDGVLAMVLAREVGLHRARSSAWQKEAEGLRIERNRLWGEVAELREQVRLAAERHGPAGAEPYGYALPHQLLALERVGAGSIHMRTRRDDHHVAPLYRQPPAAYREPPAVPAAGTLTREEAEELIFAYGASMDDDVHWAVSRAAEAALLSALTRSPAAREAAESRRQQAAAWERVWAACEEAGVVIAEREEAASAAVRHILTRPAAGGPAWSADTRRDLRLMREALQQEGSWRSTTDYVVGVIDRIRARLERGEAPDGLVSTAERKLRETPEGDASQSRVGSAGEAPAMSVECVFCRTPIPPEECDEEQSDGAPLSSSACALDDGRWVCSRACWERAVRMWDEAPTVGPEVVGEWVKLWGRPGYIGDAVPLVLTTPATEAREG